MKRQNSEDYQGEYNGDDDQIEQEQDTINNLNDSRTYQSHSQSQFQQQQQQIQLNQQYSQESVQWGLENHLSNKFTSNVNQITNNKITPYIQTLFLSQSHLISQNRFSVDQLGFFQPYDAWCDCKQVISRTSQIDNHTNFMHKIYQKAKSFREIIEQDFKGQQLPDVINVDRNQAQLIDGESFYYIPQDYKQTGQSINMYQNEVIALRQLPTNTLLQQKFLINRGKQTAKQIKSIISDGIYFRTYQLNFYFSGASNIGKTQLVDTLNQSKRNFLTTFNNFNVEEYNQENLKVQDDQSDNAINIMQDLKQKSSKTGFVKTETDIKYLVMHQNNQVNLRLTNYDIEQLIVEFILSPDYKLRNLLASEIHPYLNRVIYKHHKSHEEIYQSYQKMQELMSLQNSSNLTRIQYENLISYPVNSLKEQEQQHQQLNHEEVLKRISQYYKNQLDNIKEYDLLPCAHLKEIQKMIIGYSSVININVHKCFFINVCNIKIEQNKSSQILFLNLMNAWFGMYIQIFQDSDLFYEKCVYDDFKFVDDVKRMQYINHSDNNLSIKCKACSVEHREMTLNLIKHNIEYIEKIKRENINNIININQQDSILWHLKKWIVILTGQIVTIPKQNNNLMHKISNCQLLNFLGNKDNSELFGQFNWYGTFIRSLSLSQEKLRIAYGFKNLQVDELFNLKRLVDQYMLNVNDNRAIQNQYESIINKIIEIMDENYNEDQFEFALQTLQIEQMKKYTTYQQLQKDIINGN